MGFSQDEVSPCKGTRIRWCPCCLERWQEQLTMQVDVAWKKHHSPDKLRRNALRLMLELQTVTTTTRSRWRPAHQRRSRLCAAAAWRWQTTSWTDDHHLSTQSFFALIFFLIFSFFFQMNHARLQSLFFHRLYCLHPNRKGDVNILAALMCPGEHFPIHYFQQNGIDGETGTTDPKHDSSSSTVRACKRVSLRELCFVKVLMEICRVGYGGQKSLQREPRKATKKTWRKTRKSVRRETKINVLVSRKTRAQWLNWT